MKPPKGALGIFVLLAAAAFFYLQLIQRYYLGYYADDAFYVVAARSLLQGHYNNLFLPNHPPMNHPLPGYPLFLAPFAAMAQPHWEALPYLSVLLMIVSCSLLWNLAGEWLTQTQRLLLAGLFAFNPTSVGLSGVLLSETWFLTLVLLIFNLLTADFSRDRGGKAVLLGVLTGWAALVRPQGAVLIPCVCLALILKKNGRTAGWSTATAAALWGGFLARNLIAAKTPAEYVSLWGTGSPGLFSALRVFIANGGRFIEGLVTQNICPFPFGLFSRPRETFQTLLCIAVLALAFKGFVRLVSDKKESAPVAWALSLFCLLYGLIHAGWLAIDLRYFLPLEPFVLLAVLKAVADNSRPLFHQWRTVVVVGVLAGTYAYQDRFAWADARQPPMENRLPRDAWRWVAENTPESAVLLTNGAAELYLYTGRHAVASIPAADARQLKARLAQAGVGYVVFRPRHLFALERPGQRGPEAEWRRRFQWVTENPRDFRQVYRNPKEAISIYQVI